MRHILRPMYRSVGPGTLRVIAGALRRLPVWSLRPISLALGWLTLPLIVLLSGRQGQRNLTRAFGDELSPAERRRRVRHAQINQIACFVDAIALGHRPEALLAAHADPDALHDQLHAMRDPDRGLIVMSGHVGAWELTGILVSEWFPTSVIARRSRNERLNRVVETIRGCDGMQVLYHDEPPRTLVRALQQGRVLAVLADNPPKDTASVTVRFFGQPTRMAVGPVNLARLAGAPFAYLASVRMGGRYHVRIDGPHRVPDTGDRDANTLACLQGYASFLEQVIRDHPDNWVPFVKSWRKLPPVTGAVDGPSDRESISGG